MAEIRELTIRTTIGDLVYDKVPYDELSVELNDSFMNDQKLIKIYRDSCTVSIKLYPYIELNPVIKVNDSEYNMDDDMVQSFIGNIDFDIDGVKLQQLKNITFVSIETFKVRNPILIELPADNTRGFRFIPKKTEYSDYMNMSVTLKPCFGISYKNSLLADSRISITVAYSNGISKFASKLPSEIEAVRQDISSGFIDKLLINIPKENYSDFKLMLVKDFQISLEELFSNYKYEDIDVKYNIENNTDSVEVAFEYQADTYCVLSITCNENKPQEFIDDNLEKMEEYIKNYDSCTDVWKPYGIFL